MNLFENYENNIKEIDGILNEYGIKNLEEAKNLCDSKIEFPYETLRKLAPISYDRACWAYITGAAIAIKNNKNKAKEAIKDINIGLNAFREKKIETENIVSLLLNDNIKCVALKLKNTMITVPNNFIETITNLNQIRKIPLKIILSGVSKERAMILSTYNGFIHCKTNFNCVTCDLEILGEKNYGRKNIKCYGSNSLLEEMAIMEYENVDITMNVDDLTIGSTIAVAIAIENTLKN
ncbi:MAG: GGGtGRT protein [Cetobacterium sp.]|nr:GGGtGRT protein [Cetobacterium sp.]